MYNNFKYYKNNSRFGFAAPFLLGALTGGVTTYALNPNNYYVRPVYYNYPYFY